MFNVIKLIELKMDIKNVCRICLTKEDLYDIFSDTNDISLSEKLNECGNLMVYLLISLNILSHSIIIYDMQ